MKANSPSAKERQKKEINWKFFYGSVIEIDSFRVDLFISCVFFTLVFVSLPGRQGLCFLFNSWIVAVGQLLTRRIFAGCLGKCQRRVTGR